MLSSVGIEGIYLSYWSNSIANDIFLCGYFGSKRPGTNKQPSPADRKISTGAENGLDNTVKHFNKMQ